MALNFEGKDMHPINVFRWCCWSIHSKVVRLGKHAYGGQQTERSHSHTNPAISRHVHMHALLVQHLYSEFFQLMVWYGPTSEAA